MFRLVTIGRTVVRYWKMAHDPRTPAAVRYIIYGGLAFSAIPDDWLPDWLPGLGLLDDAAVVPTVIAAATLMIPQNVKEEYAQKEEADIENKRQEGDHYKPSEGALVTKPA